MSEEAFHPRHLEPRILEALSDTPVVLLHGPRQCGKSSLCRRIGEARGYHYLSFDDDVVRAAAESDPVRFFGDLPDKVILDEVQRVPSLFTSIKISVDRRRTPGRFLLTGSANVLLIPRLADSLAGRMEVLRLHPLAQCELAGVKPRFLDALFGEGFKMYSAGRLGNELARRVVAGGFPPALARSTEARRAAWYRDYADTLVQRDVREMARIAALDAMPRLLALACGQTARLFNASDLASPFQLSRPTIADYVTLLERIFLLERLPPWHSNRLSRLIKTPKLHLGDSGLAAALLGIGTGSVDAQRETYGQLLETFVYQELRRQASWREEPIAFHHFRDRDGVEVDLVLERGASQVAGVEIKASSTVRESDFRGLRKLAEATGKKFAGGVVLFDGESCVAFARNLFAVPIRWLWEDFPGA